MVALGTRAYLGLLDNEELIKGHCRIVPIQHHFSSLDADEETWDEIKVDITSREDRATEADASPSPQNFMKTLMQMFAEEDKGVVFFESCISLKHQKHTCIEAVPVPFDLFDEIPAYFAVSRSTEISAALGKQFSSYFFFATLRKRSTTRSRSGRSTRSASSSVPRDRSAARSSRTCRTLPYSGTTRARRAMVTSSKESTTRRIGTRMGTSSRRSQARRAEASSRGECFLSAFTLFFLTRAF